MSGVQWLMGAAAVVCVVCVVVFLVSGWRFATRVICPGSARTGEVVTMFVALFAGSSCALAGFLVGAR